MISTNSTTGYRHSSLPMTLETSVRRWERCLELIHERGKALADDELVASDAIVPPEDASVAEIRELLGEEGLIPG